jgi:hypothetical protein
MKYLDLFDGSLCTRLSTQYFLLYSDLSLCSPQKPQVIVAFFTMQCTVFLYGYDVYSDELFNY